MATAPLERRLAAILSADAVGYSRLMGRDDEGTVRALDAHRRRIERQIDTFRGRLVDATGDNLLAEFPSVVSAVRCAVEMQRATASENEHVDPEQRMEFRIGIHLGDVIVEDARLYGSGVNIAARLEALAKPGAVCFSDFVYQQVRGKLETPAIDLGEQQLKNIEEPVRAYQILREGETAPAAAGHAGEPEALALPDKPSLAVMPFANLSGDPSQEYFSEGLVDDLLTELTRIPGLFVIGHDATHTYRKTGTKPLEAARQLGVRHVLEGAVRWEDQRARITARLVDTETGRIVWSERYDRLLEDVFAVQDEIVHEVVTVLDATLVGGGNATTVRKHLRNPRALGLLYRGSDLLHRFNREDMREAREIFEQVIGMEPESPFGYLEAAWTLYFEVQRGWSEDPEATLEEMSEMAHRALELGDVSGMPSLILSHLHLMRREHEKANAMSERALEERPSCQGAYSLRANILNYCGRAGEAIPLAKQAVRLSPVAETFYPEVLTASHYLAGQLEEAIAAAHATLRLAPDSVDARVVLAAALVETGRADVARQVVQEVLAIDPSFTLKRFASAQPYRETAVLSGLVDSLRRAGFPEADEGTVAMDPVALPRTPSRRRTVPRPRH